MREWDRKSNYSCKNQASLRRILVKQHQTQVKHQDNWERIRGKTPALMRDPAFESKTTQGTAIGWPQLTTDPALTTRVNQTQGTDIDQLRRLAGTDSAYRSSLDWPLRDRHLTFTPPIWSRQDPLIRRLAYQIEWVTTSRERNLLLK